MLVTPLPIVMLVRRVHNEKGSSPMLVTLSGIVMLVRPVHNLKASSPMLVTLSGIVMLVRLLELPVLKKAIFPIVVTGLPFMVSGMTSSPDALLSQPVMVTESLVILYHKFLYFKLELISFSPHPPRSRGSDTMIRNKGTGFMGQGLLFGFFL